MIKKADTNCNTASLYWENSHRLQSLLVQSQCGQWGSCTAAGDPASHELSLQDERERWQESPGHRETPNISLGAALGNPREEGWTSVKSMKNKGIDDQKRQGFSGKRTQEDYHYTWITVRGLSDGYQRGKPKRVTHAERIRYVSEHLVLITLAPKHRCSKPVKLNVLCSTVS